ncbi:MAG: ABC transporter substrate-binding protein [Calditrichota bacterium]
MKVCSFLPASTEIIYQLGLEAYLCGVTFECPSDKPKVVRSPLEGNSYSSAEIDQIVAASQAEGKSLYYIDEELLQELSPDIIFTQDVCEVCQIDTAYVQRAVHKLKKQPRIIPLLPKNLNDVYDNILTIAKAMQYEEKAHQLLAALKKRTDDVTDTLRKHKAPLRRVMLIEWLDPIYNCGHWIPDQIAQAGAVDMLANPSGYSIKVDWEKIKQCDPEVLMIAPCGLSMERAVKEVPHLEALPGWLDVKAVKNQRVFIVNSDLFTCPGPRLVDGIELLASLFHPDIFKKFRHQYADSFKQVTISQYV